jgi:ABC-type glycerol-3-phosphate transport system permease component
MKAYLEDLPSTLEDTARLEGMRPFSYMVRILAPLSRPVITTAVMVAFLAAWNGFMAPLLFLNDDTKYTISLKLYSYVGSIASGSSKWNLFAAASIINSVIIMGIFLRFRRPVQTTDLEEVEE